MGCPKEGTLSRLMLGLPERGQTFSVLRMGSVCSQYFEVWACLKTRRRQVFSGLIVIWEAIIGQGLGCRKDSWSCSSDLIVVVSIFTSHHDLATAHLHDRFPIVVHTNFVTPCHRVHQHMARSAKSVFLDLVLERVLCERFGAGLCTQA